MTALLVAVGTAGAGLLASAIGAMLGATDGTEVGTWLAGGGSAAAVAGLAYIARRLASGDLVAVKVDTLLKASETRETLLEKLVADGRAREDALRQLLLGRQS